VFDNAPTRDKTRSLDKKRVDATAACLLPRLQHLTNNVNVRSTNTRLSMEEGTKTKKTVFIGGVADDVNEQTILETFSAFGAQTLHLSRFTGT
jgi:RNA recognition motif-containing protein